MEMELGMEVEVGCNEPGLKGSWYEAKIVRRVPKTNRVSVQYLRLVSDDDHSHPLRELVDANLVRPRRPPLLPADDDNLLRVGVRVEAFHLDGWWVGVVLAVPDPPSTSKFLVYFSDSHERLEFRRSLLRLHRKWDGRKWLPPSYVPNNKIYYAGTGPLRKRTNHGDVELMSKKKLKKVPTTSEGQIANSVRSIGDETPNEVLESRISFDNVVELIGDNAKQADAIVQSANVRAEAEVGTSDSSKRATIQDVLTSCVSQNNSQKEATEANSNPSTPQEERVSDETLNEIWKRSPPGKLSVTPGLRLKKFAVRRKVKSKQQEFRHEGVVEVCKHNIVDRSDVQLENDDDDQQLRKKHNAQQESVTICMQSKFSECQFTHTEVVKASSKSSSCTLPENLQAQQESVPICMQVDTPVSTPQTNRDDFICQGKSKSSNDQSTPVEVVRASSKFSSSTLPENLHAQLESACICMQVETPVSTPQTNRDDFICQEGNKSSEDQSAQKEVAQSNTQSSVREVQSLRGPDLPFVKSSPMWEVLQSLKVFNAMPQSPHFQPLKEHCEMLREGLAIGHMISFANLVEATSKMQIGNDRSVYGKMLVAITEFEGHGFDCQPIRDRLKELTQLKEGFVLSKSKLVELEAKFDEQKCRKDDLDAKIKTIDDEITMMQEKRELLRKMRETINVELLQKEVQTLKDTVLNAERDFQKLAAAPLEALLTLPGL